MPIGWFTTQKFLYGRGWAGSKAEAMNTIQVSLGGWQECNYLSHCCSLLGTDSTGTWSQEPEPRFTHIQILQRGLQASPVLSYMPNLAFLRLVGSTDTLLNIQGQHLTLPQV